MELGSSAATLEEDGDLVARDGNFCGVLHRFAVDILDRLPHCLQLLNLAGSDLKIKLSWVFFQGFATR